MLKPVKINRKQQETIKDLKDGDTFCFKGYAIPHLKCSLSSNWLNVLLSNISQSVEICRSALRSHTVSLNMNTLEVCINKDNAEIHLVNCHTFESAD